MHRKKKEKRKEKEIYTKQINKRKAKNEGKE